MSAEEVLDRISLDEIEWKRQLDAEILERDRLTREHYPEYMRQKGLEEGRAEAQAEIAALKAELARYKAAALATK